jgi:cell division protein FtsZ
MYDDAKTDEAVITVIATGLHSVGQIGSSLKERLDSKQKMGSILPSGDAISKMPELPPMPSLGKGLLERDKVVPPRDTNTASPTLRPRTGSIKEMDIKIPDFFKK